MLRSALRRFLVTPALMLAAAFFFCLVSVSSALAQVPVPPVTGDTSGEKLVSMLFEAVANSNWRLVAVVALMLLVWLLRKFGGKWIPFLATDRGGVALALGLAVVGGIVNGALAGKPINLSLVLSAIVTGLATMGLWSGGKAAATPKDG